MMEIGGMAWVEPCGSTISSEEWLLAHDAYRPGPGCVAVKEPQMDNRTRPAAGQQAVVSPRGLAAAPRELRSPYGSKPQHFVWFTPAIALLLGGYLFFNKSFAYVHVPGTPVYVGEVVLLIGVAELLFVRSPWRHLLATSPVLKVLLLLMAVCSARLLVDLGTY